MSIPKPPRNSPGKRRRFDPEFKHEAVKLAKQIGFSQAATDLGVNESNLRNWAAAIEAAGPLAFAPRSERDDAASELRRLREENRILKMERDILKKATVFFAKENG